MWLEPRHEILSALQSAPVVRTVLHDHRDEMNRVSYEAKQGDAEEKRVRLEKRRAAMREAGKKSGALKTKRLIEECLKLGETPRQRRNRLERERNLRVKIAKLNAKLKTRKR